VPADPLFASLRVCGGCFTLRGPFPYVWNDTDYSFVQECRCERDARPPGERAPKWISFDFNTAAELCRGCGAVALRSGTRWSIWFCDECRDRAVERNREVGTAVVPIGRHSLLHGLGLPGSPAPAGRDVDAFVARFGSLAERMRLVDDWSREVVRRNLVDAGLDRQPAISLPRYLAAVAGVDRAGRFTMMFEWLEDRSGPARP
jgi:hypothetical protein